MEENMEQDNGDQDCLFAWRTEFLNGAVWASVTDLETYISLSMLF